MGVIEKLYTHLLCVKERFPMMKRAIWIIVALLVAAYFVNSCLENKSKKDAQKAEAERIEKATKAAVA